MPSFSQINCVNILRMSVKLKPRFLSTEAYPKIYSCRTANSGLPLGFYTGKVQSRPSHVCKGRRRWDDEDYEEEQSRWQRGKKRGGKKWKETPVEQPEVEIEVPASEDDSPHYTATEFRRVLGVDFGSRRTGVAVSAGGLAPRALPVLELKGLALVERIIEIAIEENVQELVVGIPKHTQNFKNKIKQSGKTKDTPDEPPFAKRVRSFARKLATRAKECGERNVFLYDESYTSKDAMSYLLSTGSNRKVRREHLDSYSAAKLLEGYFRRSSGEPEKVKPHAGLWVIPK